MTLAVISWVNPNHIEMVRRMNARTINNQGFTTENMGRLRNNIRLDGLRHALLVRQMSDHVRLVAGERRLRSILSLLEEDLQAKQQGRTRVSCRNPRTGVFEPASQAYDLVECKVTQCPDDRDARRQNISENALHEPLTDYEMLQQVKELEDDGFSRVEQAETLGFGVAWVSQSHGLLQCHPKLLQYLESKKITRTAAIQLLSISAEDLLDVLDRAVQITHTQAAERIHEAEDQRNIALAEIETANDTLIVAQFTGDTKKAKKARRLVTKAAHNIDTAERKLLASQQKSSKITGQTCVTAAKQLGTSTKSLPLTPKQISMTYERLGQWLETNKSEFLEAVHLTLGFVCGHNNLDLPI